MLKLDVRVANVFNHVLSNTPPGTRVPPLKKRVNSKKTQNRKEHSNRGSKGETHACLEDKICVVAGQPRKPVERWDLRNQCALPKVCTHVSTKGISQWTDWLYFLEM